MWVLPFCSCFIRDEKTKTKQTKPQQKTRNKTKEKSTAPQMKTDSLTEFLTFPFWHCLWKSVWNNPCLPNCRGIILNYSPLSVKKHSHWSVLTSPATGQTDEKFWQLLSFEAPRRGRQRKERNKIPLLNFISVFFCVISKSTFAFSLLNKLHMAMQFSLKSLA